MVLTNRIDFLSKKSGKKLFACDNGSCSSSCTGGSKCSSCSVGCSEACGDCGSTCGDGCKGTCDGCSGGCTSCTGCGTGCGSGCTNGCKGCGSCGGACSTCTDCTGCDGCSGCGDSCSSGCGGACSTGCTGTCTTTCGTGCGNNCKSTCTDACNNACTSTNNVNQINMLGSNIKRDQYIKSEDIKSLKTAIDNEISRRKISNANIGFSNSVEVGYKIYTEHMNAIMKQTSLVTTFSYTNLNSGDVVYANNFDSLVTLIKKLQLQNINS